MQPSPKKKKKKKKTPKSPDTPPPKKRPTRFTLVERQLDFSGRSTTSGLTSEDEVNRYDLAAYNTSFMACNKAIFKTNTSLDMINDSNSNRSDNDKSNEQDISVDNNDSASAQITDKVLTEHDILHAPIVISTSPTSTPPFSTPQTHPSTPIIIPTLQHTTTLQNTITTTSTTIVTTTQLTYSHGLITHSTPNVITTHTISKPPLPSPPPVLSHNDFISEYATLGNNPSNTVDPPGITTPSTVLTTEPMQVSPGQGPSSVVSSLHSVTLYPNVVVKKPKRRRKTAYSSTTSSSADESPGKKNKSPVLVSTVQPSLLPKRIQLNRTRSASSQGSNPIAPVTKDQVTTNKKNTTSDKPPAIHIYSKKNNYIIKALNQAVESPPTYKYNNTSLICIPKSQIDHNKIVNTLAKAQIEFYTHNPVATRPIKIIVKYIPLDVTDEEIKEDLLSKELPLIKLARIMITRNGVKQPSNILLLTIPRDLADNYYSLNELCGLRVTVATYLGPPVNQCHNCQGFAHSSQLCNRKAKCIRCSLDHRGQPCTATECKCANCGLQHPSNYRGCQAYVNALKRYNPTTIIQESHTVKPPPPPPADIRQFPPLPKPQPQGNASTASAPVVQPSANRPWTSTARKPAAQPTTSSQESSGLFKELTDLFKQFNITKIWAALKQLLEKLKSISDPMEKLLVIVESVLTYFS